MSGKQGFNVERGKQGFQPTGPASPSDPSNLIFTPSLSSPVSDTNIAETIVGQVDSLHQAFQSLPPLHPPVAEIDVSSFRINESYPFPQANSIAKLASAVDAIEEEADTDDAIAHALDVDPRQGSYYASAAAYLGLAVERTHASPRAWELTGAGEAFLSADTATRTVILQHLVTSIPEMREHLQHGSDVEVLLGNRPEYSDSTAGRRAATVMTWYETVTDTSKAARELTLENDGMRERLTGAQQIATDGRTRAREHAAASLPRVLPACPTCHMQMPATGICDNCD